MDEQDFTGWSNQIIVPKLSDQLILEHLQKIQRAGQIALSQNLEGRFNLTIEMETGVGKKIAVKGITETGSTATESYVYLESINLSKADPTATIQFDVKGAKGPRKVSRTVGIGYNLYDNSGQLEEYRDGFVVKFIDGRDDHIEFLNGIKMYAGDVIGKVYEMQLRHIQIRETILLHIQRGASCFTRESRCCLCSLSTRWRTIGSTMPPDSP